MTADVHALPTPDATADLPAPPKHLAAPSQQLWRQTVEAYELAPHELKLLRLALEALDRCEQARRAIRRHGMVHLDRWDKPVARPEVKIEADSRAAFARLMTQLGLPEEDDPAASWGRPKRGRGGRYETRSN
jgi:phage terminase small subunit